MFWVWFAWNMEEMDGELNDVTHDYFEICFATLMGWI